MTQTKTAPVFPWVVEWLDKQVSEQFYHEVQSGAGKQQAWLFSTPILSASSSLTLTFPSAGRADEQAWGTHNLYRLELDCW